MNKRSDIMSPMTIQLFIDQISALELHIQELVPQSTVDFVIKDENKLTLSEIKACFENVSNTEKFKQSLKTILATRWSRISYTPMCYTQAPFNPINRFCLDLANQLSPLPNTQDEIADLGIGEGPYFILMPSLVVATDISGTNIHEYKLHQFILSDDERLFIPLQLCLDYAAVQAHGLTHVTSTDINQYSRLTASEQERVSNHSTPVHNYLKAILQLQKTKKEAIGLGPQLSQLIEALRNGGAHREGGGDEYNSGAAANTGIVKFSEYLNTLSEKTKNEFYEKHSAYKVTGLEILPYPGLKTLIDRLTRPTDASFLETIYCVELIADYLEKLVDHYGITTKDITFYEACCETTKRQLNLSINQEFDYILLPFKKVEKISLASSSAMTLNEMNFDKHLEKFRAIEALMQKKCESVNKLMEKQNKNKPTYQAAANAAKLLCQTLTAAKADFLKNHNKIQFLTCCKNAINNAEELKKHRGCKLTLAKFLRDILSLISKKAARVLTNKNHLFAPKTASHKELELFENIVSRLSI